MKEKTPVWQLIAVEVMWDYLEQKIFLAAMGQPNVLEISARRPQLDTHLMEPCSISSDSRGQSPFCWKLQHKEKQ